MVSVGRAYMRAMLIMLLFLLEVGIGAFAAALLEVSSAFDPGDLPCWCVKARCSGIGYVGVLSEQCVIVCLTTSASCMMGFLFLVALACWHKSAVRAKGCCMLILVGLLAFWQLAAWRVMGAS